MGKFIVFGVIAYLAVGLFFLRMTVTGIAKQKRTDPEYKIEYLGCTFFVAAVLWPLLPIVYLIIGGVIKDMKKLKQEISSVESLLAEEQEKVKQYEMLIKSDPSTQHLFEDDLKESRRKCTKWEADLKKLKAEYEKANIK
jgi:septal ring factor EnvC (AmiA/AmiB activator)